MDLKRKRILVTGGAGFLGRHLCRLMQQQGIPVTEYNRDSLTSKAQPGCHYIRSKDFDLVNPTAVHELLHALYPDIIIHLAASVGGIGINRDKPGTFYYRNLMMGTNLIETASRLAITKYVQVGTVCFPAGTPVLLDGNWQNIESATVGQLASTHTGKQFSVHKTYKNQFQGQLKGIKTVGLPTIYSTDDHPYLVSDQGKLSWKAAKDLRPGDFIATPIKRPPTDDALIDLIQGKDLRRWAAYHSVKREKHRRAALQIGLSYQTASDWLHDKHKPIVCNIPQPVVTTQQLAWLIGAYVAEGFSGVSAISKQGKRGCRNYISWTPGYDEDFATQIADKYETIFGKRPRIERTRTSLRLSVGDKFAAPIFLKCYAGSQRRAHNKAVPDLIRNGSIQTIIEFIRGYWKGDGHFSIRKKGKKQYLATCTSVSRNLLLQVKDLLLKIGIHSGFYIRKKPKLMRIEGRLVRPRISYSLRITGKWSIVFAKIILNKELSNSAQTRPNDPVFTNDYVYTPIRSTTTRYYSGPVYNIAVRGDESYRAFGVAVHNCSYPIHTPAPFKEEDLWNGAPEPTNAPYGIAKKALLTQIQAYNQEFKFPGIYLIPVNLYGPYDNFDPYSSHVIPALIRKFVDARDNNIPTVECWGTGEATREFLYVDDAARGILLATEKYDETDPINLGSGTDIKISELATLIAKMVEYPGEIIWNSEYPDGQPKRQLDTTKAEKLFGFKAITSFPTGLRQTINYYEKFANSSQPRRSAR